MRNRNGTVGAARGCSAAGGFSLVELLVVVAIIGLLAMIGIAQVGAAFKRQRLASSAYDLKPLVQRLKSDGQDPRWQTFDAAGTSSSTGLAFLRVAPARADGAIPVQVFVDTNANSQLDVATDRLVREVLVPAELVVSSPAVGGFGVWDQWVKVSDTDHYAGCDSIGRTINPTTGVQVVRPLRLELTHGDMVSGSLTPQVTWTLTVNPVWNATLAQRLGP